VKPFVRRGKNDRNDAEAICEAASRPSMPSVPVKAAEQQAAAIVLSARELLVRQRTQLLNAVRGHAAEFGIVAAKNISHLPALLKAIVAEAAVPEAAKTMLTFLGAQVAQLDEQIAELERQMKQRHKSNPVSQLLAEIPGIGPITALSPGTDDRPRAVPVRAPLRGVARSDTKRTLDWWSPTAGRHQPGRQRAAASIARRRCDGGHSLCQAGKQERIGLVARIAGAQTAKARGCGSGQQDGPHRVGHDGERRSISGAARGSPRRRPPMP
jgi:hypothetical protein